MIESVQVRQRGAFDFETHYDNLCALQDSCPLPAVKAHLTQGVLDLNGDRIRANDWMPVLNTLRINKSLEFVAIRSYYTPPSDENDALNPFCMEHGSFLTNLTHEEATSCLSPALLTVLCHQMEKKALIEKRKTPAVRSKEITYRICKTLKECLGVTPALSCLEIQGLPLRDRDLTTLMKGIVKNNTVTHFSLEYCRIGDAGIEIICKGVKNSTSINSVNFTGCSLTWRGADALAKVIKHQGTRRHNEAWRDSLRYRRPDLDRMPGIRRITINNNPMIGDQGATVLAEALKDDLWLKALDMQGNGISSTGAKALLDVLKYNTTLVVLDVRRNPLIDRDLVHAIMEQLMINCNGQDTEYKWIKAEENGDKGKQLKKRTKTLNSSFGRKTTIRITAGAASRRRTKSAESVAVSRKMKPISSEGVKAGPGLPWRTAARANRYRGYPPEHIPGQSSLLEKSEDYTPRSGNQSAIFVSHGDRSTEDEDLEDSVQEEFNRMKLDDSNLSTAIKGKNVQVELVQLRRQIQEERLARMKSEQRVVELTLDNKKIREENSRLRRNKGSVLDDDSVLDSIEASFKQFHEFLDLLRDAGLGKLITMAGLDAEGSPFNNSTKEHLPKFRQQVSRSNGFSGDISSGNQINDSVTLYGKNLNGNIRPRPYLSSNIQDPTMKNSYIDDSRDETQARRDELYERILHETSNAFKRLNEHDVTVDTTGTQNDDADDDKDDTLSPVGKKGSNTSHIPVRDRKKVGSDNEEQSYMSDKLDSIKGPEGEIIRSLSPFDDSVVDGETPRPPDSKVKGDNLNEDRMLSPDKGQTSRVSDFSYGMDSFEQSYVSERGEVLHLGDEIDFYPESPSPIQQDSDQEEF